MKKLISLIISAVLVCSLASCSMEKDAPEVPQNHTPDGKEVVASGEITVASANPEADIKSLTTGYQTIVCNKRGAFVQNSTAVETMTVKDNPDGTKTYTFTIKDDLLFSDGSKVSARDYVFTVLALKNIPELKGYDSYSKGETSVFSGVRLLAENKFSLTLRSDAFPHYYESALMSVFPLPVAVICPDYKLSDSADGVSIENIDTAALESYLENPAVVSGAYIPQGDVLTVNPYFKGNYEEQKPTIEKITFVPLTSSSNIDLIPDSTEDLQGFKKTPHTTGDVTTLFSGCDFRNETSLVNALRPYFNTDDEELVKIADYLLETAEFDVTEFTEKWDSLPKINPEVSVYDYSSDRIRGFSWTTDYWRWTNQILYCFIARE